VEREQDKLYAQLASAQQEKSELVRQQFFGRMKGYQDRNDAKTAQLQNFMAGKDLASLSRVDEARYLKAVEDKEAEAQKKADRQRLAARNDQAGNLAMLRQQMLEKEQRKRLERLQDDSFAAVVKQ